MKWMNVLFSSLLGIVFLWGGAVLNGQQLTSSTKIPWNSDLSLSGGGFWTGRQDVTVTNHRKTALDNYYLSIPLSKSNTTSGLSLVGQQAETLRVCNEQGREILFDIQGVDGLAFHRGTLTAGMNLVLSVTCPAEQSVVFSVYYGNEQSWFLPDWLPSRTAFVNLDFEKGRGPLPSGWSFESTDEKHRVIWSDENPKSGKKNIKVIVDDGAESTWVSARQQNIAAAPGAKFRFSAWVKGENIKGNVGWFFHLGTKANSMMASPTISAGSGTFDWKQVTQEITLPEGADLLAHGTVLYGTGTAWFDAVEIVPLTKVDDASLSFSVAAPIPFDLEHRYPTGKREKGTFIPTAIPIQQGARYVLLRVLNSSSKEVTKTVRIDLAAISTRWNHSLTNDDFLLYDSSNAHLQTVAWNGQIFFEAALQKNSCHYFLLVEKPLSSSQEDGVARRNNAIDRSVKKEGESFPGTSQQVAADGDFPGTSQQKEVTKQTAVQREPFPEFLNKRNVVINGDMESGGEQPEGWNRASSEKEVSYRVVDPQASFLGKRALEMSVAPDAKHDWRGWRQKVAVTPGSRYFGGIWMASDSKEGGYLLHLHHRKADGSLGTGGMSSIGSGIGGKTDWTLLSDVIAVDAETHFVEFHLTTNQSGTVRYDGAFLIEMDTADICEFSGGIEGIFQVSGIIKVFEDSTFPTKTSCLSTVNPAKISAAGNEQESLQIAIRKPYDHLTQVAVTPPVLTGAGTAQFLPSPAVFAVGNVPVDYPSSYYNTKEESPIRHLPRTTPGCDGWSGWWPDPLIPVNATQSNSALIGPSKNSDIFPQVQIQPRWNTDDYSSDSEKLADLGKSGLFFAKAQKTRALWLIFSIPENTPAGIYQGTILLKDAVTKQIDTIPYTVEVFGFSLPKDAACGAIYDARIGNYFSKDKTSTQTLREVVEFITDKKLIVDHVPPPFSMKYDLATDRVDVDWTEFDKMGHWYFDQLGVKHAYTPQLFYLFGWGLPPRANEGGNPYEGEYPFDKADRSVLRDNFKKAYQAKLRVFWDHLKSKGWDKNFVLYISDEPFYSREHIIKQMQALCQMIHEVDPAIPIYSSTWRHVPEWDGSLDVWGVGHFGVVPVEQLEKIKENKARIWWTTDGHMCLDTPYCAIERLLPYWCHYYNADVYEFWGATWYTYDPFQYGWHSYISQSDTPGERYFVRYPNGDGYILYPGNLIGVEGLISSVRMEEAREGVEDAAYLAMLRDAIEKGKDKDPADLQKAKILWNEIKGLVPIPVAAGRYSTRFLPQPEIVEQYRHEMGKMIERLR